MLGRVAPRRLVHVNVSPLERVVLAAGSAVAALRDPQRGDMIAMLGEVTADGALQEMRKRMRASYWGTELLRTRPRIRSSTVASWNLEAAPEGSLGRAYLDFVTSHGYTADGRDEVRFIEDEELAYVMQRYRETHDFAHVLTGLPPTVLGELGLKWFELVQTGMPMTALAAFVGPFRLSSSERVVMFGRLVPWASRAARQATPLYTAPFEDWLHRPLIEVRRDLHLDPAPSLELRDGGLAAGAWGAWRA